MPQLMAHVTWVEAAAYFESCEMEVYIVNRLITEIERAETIAVLGHMRPDGDCVGSTLGMYNYIVSNYPEKKVQVYLQSFSDVFMFLNGADRVKHEPDEEKYELCVVLDCSDTSRPAEFIKYFETADRTVCIDHHASNEGFGDVRYIEPDASSACEVLYKLLDVDKINTECAECIYTGIVHDTGVFKHSCTGSDTMRIAGVLIDKGARPNYVIDETFYKKTFVQNRLLGYALLNMKQFADGKITYTLLTNEDYARFGATSMDSDGVVDQLRLTSGTEVAVFMYQTGDDEYKFSLRSNDYVDVSAIATAHGGGGHVRAAGFNMSGDIDELVCQIIDELCEKL